MILELSI